MLDDNYDSDSVAYKRFDLIQIKEKKAAKKLYKLLDSDNPRLKEEETADSTTKSVDDTAIGEGQEVVTAAYWTPTLDLSLVLDAPESFPRNQVSMMGFIAS
jgi:hypothetical protein